MDRIHVLAVDLDPEGHLGTKLREEAHGLGIQFDMLRGDLNSEALRQRMRRRAPFDLALFVGLSSWLPKPDLTRHLAFLAELMSDDGVVLADVFTSGAHALSGLRAGYQASYYTPAEFILLAERAGFDGHGTRVRRSVNGINHVLRLSLPRLSS